MHKEVNNKPMFLSLPLSEINKLNLKKESGQRQPGDAPTLPSQAWVGHPAPGTSRTMKTRDSANPTLK